MDSNADASLRLEIECNHDGNYWVVKCPALQMVAAHRTQLGAWMRAARMFTSQVVYALNQDPAISALFPAEHAESAEFLRSAVRERRGVTLCFDCATTGAKFEAPGLHLASC